MSRNQEIYHVPVQVFVHLTHLKWCPHAHLIPSKWLQDCKNLSPGDSKLQFLSCEEIWKLSFWPLFPGVWKRELCLSLEREYLPSHWRYPSYIWQLCSRICEIIKNSHYSEIPFHSFLLWMCLLSPSWFQVLEYSCLLSRYCLQKVSQQPNLPEMTKRKWVPRVPKQIVTEMVLALMLHLWNTNVWFIPFIAWMWKFKPDRGVIYETFIELLIFLLHRILNLFSW